jgi:hypothetical protein
MREGWHNEDYLVLFDEAEISDASDRYAIAESLPGYEVVGLRGWDDFVVRNTAGQIYTIPSVAPEARYLSPFVPPNGHTALQGDDRFAGKIKWYVKPLRFGGEPDLAENITWVSLEQHAQLVRWWNEKYRELNAQKST